MKIEIRKANLADMGKVLEMIKELALYERAPEEVWATTDMYEAGFQKGIFEVLLALFNEKIIGCAMYYPCWSSWKGKMYYLEDFIISQPYRKKGVGQTLFNASLEEAKKNNCTLVKWQVLDWNEPALNFYRKNHAVIEKTWWNGKIVF